MYNQETKVQPMETSRRPHFIWLMDLEKNPFEDNQGDNYITKRQTYNQWRQVESLTLFGLWTLKKKSLLKITRETII